MSATPNPNVIFTLYNETPKTGSRARNATPLECDINRIERAARALTSRKLESERFQGLYNNASNLFDYCRFLLSEGVALSESDHEAIARTADFLEDPTKEKHLAMTTSISRASDYTFNNNVNPDKLLWMAGLSFPSAILFIGILGKLSLFSLTSIIAIMIIPVMLVCIAAGSILSYDVCRRKKERMDELYKQLDNVRFQGHLLLNNLNNKPSAAKSNTGVNEQQGAMSKNTPTYSQGATTGTSNRKVVVELDEKTAKDLLKVLSLFQAPTKAPATLGNEAVATTAPCKL